MYLLKIMNSQIKIILAGFDSRFTLSLENFILDHPQWAIIHTFANSEELEIFISQGGTADVLLFDDRLTRINFIPKKMNMKIFAFTSTPEKFRYDNWFYVGVTGTFNWNISTDKLNNSLMYHLPVEKEDSIL